MADPVTMAVMGASTAMSAYGSIREGDAALRAGKYNRDAAYNEAKGIDIQAQQEIAVGSHNSKTIGLRAKEILARQEAEAASGGGSSQDGTVVAIQNETVKSSSLEQLLQMAAAEETAQQLNHKGEIVRRGGDMALMEGRQKKNAAYLKAGTTLLKGASSWGQMFGSGAAASGGPVSSNAASSSLHSGNSNAAPW
jgi:hypothetical protein